MRIEKRVEAANTKAAQELKDKVEVTAADLESTHGDMVHREQGDVVLEDKPGQQSTRDEMVRAGEASRETKGPKLTTTPSVPKHHTRKHLSKNGIKGIDHLLVGRDGNPQVRDQHLDVLFRYVYPLCYCVVCVVY